MPSSQPLGRIPGVPQLISVRMRRDLLNGSLWVSERDFLFHFPCLKTPNQFGKDKKLMGLFVDELLLNFYRMNLGMKINLFSR